MVLPPRLLKLTWVPCTGSLHSLLRPGRASSSAAQCSAAKWLETLFPGPDRHAALTSLLAVSAAGAAAAPVAPILGFFPPRFRDSIPVESPGALQPTWPRATRPPSLCTGAGCPDPQCSGQKRRLQSRSWEKPPSQSSKQALANHKASFQCSSRLSAVQHGRSDLKVRKVSTSELPRSARPRSAPLGTRHPACAARGLATENPARILSTSPFPPPSPPEPRPQDAEQPRQSCQSSLALSAHAGLLGRSFSLSLSLLGCAHSTRSPQGRCPRCSTSSRRSLAPKRFFTLLLCPSLRHQQIPGSTVPTTKEGCYLRIGSVTLYGCGESSPSACTCRDLSA